MMIQNETVARLNLVQFSFRLIVVDCLSDFATISNIYKQWLVFKAKKSHLLRIDGVGEYIAQAVINQKVLARAEKEISFILQFSIQSVLRFLFDTYLRRIWMRKTQAEHYEENCWLHH